MMKAQMQDSAVACVDQYMCDVQFWSLFAGHRFGLLLVYWYYCTGPTTCKGTRFLLLYRKLPQSICYNGLAKEVLDLSRFIALLHFHKVSVEILVLSLLPCFDKMNNTCHAMYPCQPLSTSQKPSSMHAM